MVTKVKQGVIADNAVGSPQIADNAVGSTEIAADAVGTSEIASDAVGASEIATGAVGADEIADGSVGSAEIADGSIGLGDLSAAATPAFTKSFESTNQTITAAGLLTLAHGLGAAPKLVLAELVCTTSELNWGVGDRQVIACGAGADSAANRGMAVYHDATNVYVRFGSAASPIVVNNKTSGATAAITLASWRLVIRAWT